jgi:hypothetical protein
VGEFEAVGHIYSPASLQAQEAPQHDGGCAWR